jgi:septum formation topological specificity factor MinE
MFNFRRRKRKRSANIAKRRLHAIVMSDRHSGRYGVYDKSIYSNVDDLECKKFSIVEVFKKAILTILDRVKIGFLKIFRLYR